MNLQGPRGYFLTSLVMFVRHRRPARLLRSPRSFALISEIGRSVRRRRSDWSSPAVSRTGSIGATSDGPRCAAPLRHSQFRGGFPAQLGYSLRRCPRARRFGVSWTRGCACIDAHSLP